jgi:hypothetical protein
VSFPAFLFIRINIHLCIHVLMLMCIHKWHPRCNWNIVESGVNHHNPNPINKCIYAYKQEIWGRTTVIFHVVNKTPTIFLSLKVLFFWFFGGGFKLKTIKLVFIASQLNTQHLRSSSKDLLAWNQDNVLEWSDMSTRDLLFRWTSTENPTKVCWSSVKRTLLRFHRI